MRFAASRGQHSSLYAHGNRTRQQPCSHYTAICNQRIKKRIELRRHEQPLVAEHRGGTDHGRNDPNRTRRTHEVPFIAGCSHFTRENTRLRAPAFSPNDTPCNMAAESLPSAPAQVPVKLHDLHSNSILYFEYSLTLLLVM